MHPIIYDVAVSVDGYISGPDGDISRFAHAGEVVEDYTARLNSYGVAIMGRGTYEFGYRFGLAPGQNPYPHMQTYVFSEQINLPDQGDVTQMQGDLKTQLNHLKASASGPIYLCGGGAFAGALLALGAIDLLRLKRAPILLGGGVPLFGNGAEAPDLKHRSTKVYEDGYLFQEFAV